MREVKFRGKRIYNGEWVYGYYVYTHGRHRIIYEDYEGFYCEEEVAPETVGQYTGLKDKNGKEIYEGDIVKLRDYVSNDNITVVTYNYDKLQYVFTCSSIRYYSNTGMLEVLGNIYENKDLLESNSF